MLGEISRSRTESLGLIVDINRVKYLVEKCQYPVDNLAITKHPVDNSQYPIDKLVVTAWY